MAVYSKFDTSVCNSYSQAASLSKKGFKKILSNHTIQSYLIYYLLHLTKILKQVELHLLSSKTRVKMQQLTNWFE